jgi:nicotinate dehydrogenase subunit B
MKSGWKERPSPSQASGEPKSVGRGLALIARGNTLVAAVAEVEVDRSRGIAAVKRMTVGHDCGLIINPDSLNIRCSVTSGHDIGLGFGLDTAKYRCPGD